MENETTLYGIDVVDRITCNGQTHTTELNEYGLHIPMILGNNRLIYFRINWTTLKFIKECLETNDFSFDHDWRE